MRFSIQYVVGCRTEAHSRFLVGLDRESCELVTATQSPFEQTLAKAIKTHVSFVLEHVKEEQIAKDIGACLCFDTRLTCSQELENAELHLQRARAAHDSLHQGGAGRRSCFDDEQRAKNSVGHLAFVQHGFDGFVTPAACRPASCLERDVGWDCLAAELAGN